MIKLLVFALSFLGLLAGILLARLAKEELYPGRKYLILLEKVALLSISLVTIFYVGEFFVFLFLGILAGFVFRKHYFYLGLALPLAFGELLVLLPSLVFILGLPKGSLLASKKGFFKKYFIVSGILFLVGIVVSYLLGYAPLLMLCAGALIMSASSKKLWIFPI